MTSMNGVMSAASTLESQDSTPNASLSAKRKRDEVIGVPNTSNDTLRSKSAEVIEQSSGVTQRLIRDLIDVLKEDDTNPSILSRSLPQRPSSSGPQVKRQKSDEGSETSSILTRLSTNVYNNVKDVLEDIDAAVADIKNKLQLPDGAARNQYIPVSSSQSELSVHAEAFKERAHELVRRELASMSGNATTISSRPGATSVSGSNAITQINASSGDNRTVLTFYGNAQGNKQLFSSFQVPTKVDGEERKVIQTIREAGLPNGITTTQIVPIQATGMIDDKKRVPTLGEVFPIPSTVPSLQPPKPSKTATTRSSAVGWYHPASNEPTSRSASYSKQSISSGQWLDYSNASPPQQVTKRRQRERALSIVASKTPSLEAEPAESEASKLEALFRGAYSSFAPTRDDSAAVVPAGVMNRLWWQQVGKKNFGKLVEKWTDEEGTIPPTPSSETEIDEELIMFEKFAKEMENDSIDPNLVSTETLPEKSAEEKDVEEILEGISDLLETLNSYQRIRHMSMNASSRPAGLLSAPDTTAIGTPTKPSEHEQATYEILKSQLTLMIATLPPYAVAKLDPDRLAELSISTKIEIQTNDYKGVMEEDEAASRAKVAAINAASTTPRPAAPPQVHRSSSSSLYGNQYAAPRPVTNPTQQYYGASQTPIRPPSNNVNMQRPAVPSPAPYQQLQRPPGNAPYRTGQSYGTPTYSHQAPRPVQQPYTPSNQQYQQTPASNYMRPPSQGFPQHMSQSTPQASNMNGRYSGQTQQPGYAHQAPPAANGMGYQYANGASFNRQTSPQKMYSPQPQNTQPRSNFPTPNASMQQNSRPYLQNGQNGMNQGPPMNGSTPRPPSQQQYIPQTQTPTGYVSHHSNAAQLEIMAQQRANLDAQQETQQRARIAAQSGMNSPSKGGQVNGGNPVAAGL
ncbi:related to tpa inducible protein [Rhynchosporium graminicola]|uniref:Related to tpa inducible protein n=1 Tax=Rhynchosporium graminicola TaxID=2792576 RepID=A0A1E1KWE5_9HELO|nr:related to tpa inducible protein [Rhynchosporium commune]